MQTIRSLTRTSSGFVRRAISEILRLRLQACAPPHSPRPDPRRKITHDACTSDASVRGDGMRRGRPMGYQDRDYYREGTQTQFVTSVVVKLIILNCLVFLADL